MSALFWATNFVDASASVTEPAISFASIPSALKYPILIGTQRLKSSITCSVPRGEIQRTVSTVAPGRPNAFPAVKSEPVERTAAPTAPRLSTSRRDNVASNIPPPSGATRPPNWPIACR